MDGAERPCPDAETLARHVDGAPDAAWVADHARGCATCRARIGSERDDAALFADLLAANADRIEPAAATGPEGYVLHEEIHRGGQGVVHRATQVTTKRIVAVKIMNGGAFASERARARFDREAELVASLRHPNIVGVLEAGTTRDGRPFIAMEWVDGAPLAPPAESGLAGVRRAAELIERIAEAVAAAHRRGIMHRDLKPANVLVDERGEPRVVDFGLAKALDAEPSAAIETTQAGEFLGTFAYAAPEQVGGDAHAVDLRADLYALGVMLYELLARRRPYPLTGSLREVVAAIVETPPAPLRAIERAVDRDLETIVLRLLAKEPDRRYRSAEALRDDLARWRRGEAVAARGDDAWYLLRKSLRRHRAALAVAGLFLATAVAFGAGILRSWQRTGEELVRANATIAALAGMLGSLDLEHPEAAMPAANIRQLLDDSTRIVEEHLAAVPGVEAPARLSLARAYLSYRLFDEAERQLDVALARYAALGRRAPAEEVAAALHERGRLLWNLGRYRAAEVAYRDALARRRALHAGDDPLVATSLQHLGSCLREAGDLEEARTRMEEALAMRERLFPADHPAVALSVHVLGNTLRDLGRTGEAILRYEDAIRRLRARYGDGNWREGRTQHNVAACLIDLGRLDEAAARIDRSIAIKTTGASADPAEPASAALILARLDLAQGRSDAALALAERAFAGRVGVFGALHPEVAEAQLVRARARLATGDVAGAVEDAEAALALRRERLGDDHWRVGEALVVVALCRFGAGDAAAAQAALVEAEATLAELDAEAPIRREARRLAG